jgi:hypothetical protein
VRAFRRWPVLAPAKTEIPAELAFLVCASPAPRTS